MSSSCSSKHIPLWCIFFHVTSVVGALAVSAVGGVGGGSDGSGLGWVMGEGGVGCVIGACCGAGAACTDGGNGAVAACLKGDSGVVGWWGVGVICAGSSNCGGTVDDGIGGGLDVVDGEDVAVAAVDGETGVDVVD